MGIEVGAHWGTGANLARDTTRPVSRHFSWQRRRGNIASHCHAGAFVVERASKNVEQVPVTGHSTRVVLTYSESNSCNGRETKADFNSIFAEYDRTFVSSYFDELAPSHVTAVHDVDRFAPRADTMRCKPKCSEPLL